MASIQVDFTRSRGTIDPDIYGHFAELLGGVFYDGLWVGEDSPVENVRGFRKALVDSFKKLNPPVLRWPGGCFAETYDWRDGIGPRDHRPVRVNWWYSRDHRTEPNQVGTHEFMDFCRMVGAKPYVAANLTTLPALHIRNWMEYCNFPSGTALSDERAKNGAPDPFNVVFWGIGNENWGGGGEMTPEMCAREYMRFATACSSLNDQGPKFIACGPNGHDLGWTNDFLCELKRGGHRPPNTHGLSVHYYCGAAGDPLAFTEDEWYQQLFQAGYMRRIVDDHRAVMDRFDPERKMTMVVDEWGCWHPAGSGPSKGYNLFEQQATLRDAVVAALTLNLFNNRCDVVSMANVAQLCNNLHTLYLAGGPHFVETPNYHVFRMFMGHKGARQLSVANGCGALERPGFEPLDRVSASASEARDGSLTITLTNCDVGASIDVALSGIGGALRGMAEIAVLAADDPHAYNDFENPNAVMPAMHRVAFADGDRVTVPAASVVSVKIGGEAQ